MQDLGSNSPFQMIEDDRMPEGEKRDDVPEGKEKRDDAPEGKEKRDEAPEGKEKRDEAPEGKEFGFELVNSYYLSQNALEIVSTT